jgi:hypothetical protein
MRLSLFAALLLAVPALADGPIVIVQQSAPPIVVQSPPVLLVPMQMPSRTTTTTVTTTYTQAQPQAVYYVPVRAKAAGGGCPLVGKLRAMKAAMFGGCGG